MEHMYGCPWCSDRRVARGPNNDGKLAWFICWSEIQHCPFCGFLFRIHCADCGHEVQRLRGGLECGHVHGYQDPCETG